MRFPRLCVAVVPWLLAVSAGASSTNYESSHVHPIDLTPSGDRLLVVNTPDAVLEVFDVASDGSLQPGHAIPVGLEPVSVVARTDDEAWVVNHLSDTVSVVDLGLGAVVRTLDVGDEPTDLAFAAGRAFVAISSLDAVDVFNLADLSAAPTRVSLPGRDLRALATDGSHVYAVALKSGNGTTVVGVAQTFPGATGVPGFDANRLAAMGLRDLDCAGSAPPYPPLPAGITRNPALTDPTDGVPPVGLIVRWDDTTASWRDDANQDWSACLPYRPADHDLFVIDAGTLAVTTVDGLGTSLFDVSVHPTQGTIYVPHTDARNFVRFEHPRGVQGHVVDNRMAIVDPADGNSRTWIDLNAHIDRDSDPATNLGERRASVSQPGMMAWRSDGSQAFLTAIGSRQIFRLDGACVADDCIFGADRSVPDSVEVGEGPTGVVLREAILPQDERLYVLNRISHSVTVVHPGDLTVLDTTPLHDPSSAATRTGRRFLYDAIDTSGHGDASCASCHLFGDMDGLVWDLGDPTGDFADYATPLDNVRFVFPQNGQAVTCPSDTLCASHDGFDPQKGPMATQTLRAMLEPLHWRGDRPTMNDFNAAFVSLMGTADVGPIDGKPAGLSAVDMEAFRQFALEIRFPPNPHRTVEDGYPCPPRSIDPGCEVNVHGSLLPGNPAEGDRFFHEENSDAGQPCVSCHTDPFGAAGGQLGGVVPTEPTAAAAAGLFNGTADGSPHSDLKVPHLRNMYEKFGPVLAPPGVPGMPETTTGFGYSHDGSIPDLFRFLSADVFTLSHANQAREVRDLVSFMFHFPTSTKPAVGRQLTLPAGQAARGTGGLLSTLMSLGDQADPQRHCELVASTVLQDTLHRYRWSGGMWFPDASGDPPLAHVALLQAATSPLTFTCAEPGAGLRLGGDRDEDSVLNRDDCAPGDAATYGVPVGVTDLTMPSSTPTTLDWSDQSVTTGSSLRYELLGVSLALLRTSGIQATDCVAGDLQQPHHTDGRPDPPPGEGYAYLIRAVNPCGAGSLGAGREVLQSLACP